MLVSRLRLVFARRPWLHWLVAALCGVALWWQLAGAQTRLDHARQRWGRTRTVWVAVQPAAGGASLAAARRAYPAAMVPTDAMGELPDHPVAARAVSAGAVLVPADVAGTGDVPAGWTVFAVGDADAPELPDGASAVVFADGQRLCDGRVAGRHDDHVEVAVAPDCAPALSARLADGAVVVGRVSG